MKMKITYDDNDRARARELLRITEDLLSPVRIRHTESGDGTLITYVRTIDKPRPGAV